ncbi:MAG: hypothetical protein WBB29_16525 [Geitlerinemataceae cyanobacterium]
MDSLQVQVTTLNRKVDGLYDIIERLSLQIAELLAQRTLVSSSTGDYHQFSGSSVYGRTPELGLLNALMEHKDVLVEDHHLDSHSHGTGDKELSAQVQIQRLTAQLTATYNRIAALEEQLLSRRAH